MVFQRFKNKLKWTRSGKRSRDADEEGHSKCPDSPVPDTTYRYLSTNCENEDIALVQYDMCEEEKLSNRQVKSRLVNIPRLPVSVPIQPCRGDDIIPPSVRSTARTARAVKATGLFCEAGCRTEPRGTFAGHSGSPPSVARGHVNSDGYGGSRSPEAYSQGSSDDDAVAHHLLPCHPFLPSSGEWKEFRVPHLRLPRSPSTPCDSPAAMQGIRSPYDHAFSGSASPSSTSNVSVRLRNNCSFSNLLMPSTAAASDQNTALEAPSDTCKLPETTPHCSSINPTTRAGYEHSNLTIVKSFVSGGLLSSVLDPCRKGCGDVVLLDPLEMRMDSPEPQRHFYGTVNPLQACEAVHNGSKTLIPSLQGPELQPKIVKESAEKTQTAERQHNTNQRLIKSKALDAPPIPRRRETVQYEEQEPSSFLTAALGFVSQQVGTFIATALEAPAEQRLDPVARQQAGLKKVLQRGPVPRRPCEEQNIGGQKKRVIRSRPTLQQQTPKKSYALASLSELEPFTTSSSNLAPKLKKVARSVPDLLPSIDESNTIGKRHTIPPTMGEQEFLRAPQKTLEHRPEQKQGEMQKKTPATNIALSVGDQLLEKTMLTPFWKETEIAPVKEKMAPPSVWQRLWHSIDPQTVIERKRRHRERVMRAGHSVITRQRWNTRLADVGRLFWRYAVASHLELTLFSVENVPYIAQVVVETAGLRFAMPFNCRFLRLPFVDDNQVVTLWFNSPVGRSQRSSSDPLTGPEEFFNDWIGSPEKDDTFVDDAEYYSGDRATLSDKCRLLPNNADEDEASEQELQEVTDFKIHPQSVQFWEAPAGEYSPKDDFRTYFRFDIPIKVIRSEENGVVEDAALIDPKGAFYECNMAHCPDDNFRLLREATKTASREPKVKFRARFVYQGPYYLITTGDSGEDHPLRLPPLERDPPSLMEKLVYVAHFSDELDQLVGKLLNEKNQRLLQSIGADGLFRLCKGKYNINGNEYDVVEATIHPETYPDFDFSAYPDITGEAYSVGFPTPVVSTEDFYQPLLDFLLKTHKNEHWVAIEKQEALARFVDISCVPEDLLPNLDPTKNKILPDHALRNPVVVQRLYRHGVAARLNVALRLFPEHIAAPSLPQAYLDDLKPPVLCLGDGSENDTGVPVTFHWTPETLQNPSIVPLSFYQQADNDCFPDFLIPFEGQPGVELSALNENWCNKGPQTAGYAGNAGPVNSAAFGNAEAYGVEESESDFLVKKLQPQDSAHWTRSTQVSSSETLHSGHISAEWLSNEAVGRSQCPSVEERPIGFVVPRLPLHSTLGAVNRSSEDVTCNVQRYPDVSQEGDAPRAPHSGGILQTARNDTLMTDWRQETSDVDATPPCGAVQPTLAPLEIQHHFHPPYGNDRLVTTNDPCEQRYAAEFLEASEPHCGNTAFQEPLEQLVKEQRINSVIYSRFTGEPLGYKTSIVSPMGEVILPDEPPLPPREVLCRMDNEQRQRLKILRTRILSQQVLEHHQIEWFRSPTYAKIVGLLKQHQLER